MEKLSKKDLYEYQIQLIDFIRYNKNSFIMVGMGLGKTVSVLSALNELQSSNNKKAVIIAPKSVCSHVWTKESVKWDFLDGQTVEFISGFKSKNYKKYNSRIYTVTYDSVGTVMKTDIFNECKYLVLDESTFIKNHSTKRFKNIKKILKQTKFEKIILLTGEPSPSGELWELFTQMYCIDKGVFGKAYTRFVNKYYVINPFTPYVKELKSASRKQIQDKIKPYSRVIKSEDYLGLPPVIYNNITVEMNKKTFKLYEQARNEFIVSLEKKEIYIQSSAILSNKLIQITSGALYDEDKKYEILHYEKVNMLKEIVDSYRCPVLVYYWFKFEKELIKEKIKNVFFIEGSTSTQDKDKILDMWNSKQLDVLCAHPKVIGHGLNMQLGSNVCVWTTVPWSVELYKQAVGRLHRTGQQKQVVVHHLTSKGTIDEIVYEKIKQSSIKQEHFLNEIKRNL